MSIQPLFLAAGWYPGRRTALPASVPADHPAAAVLIEFRGLSVGKTGAGEECATSDVAFRELRPELSITEPSIVNAWGELLGTDLVGVADIHHSHGELYVDGARRYFTAGLDENLCFAGASFGEAMERLLLGRRVQPMLRPDQDAVMVYGEMFTADHPSVYKYR